MAEVTTNKETTGLDPFPKGEFYTKAAGNFWIQFPWIFAGFIAFVVGILWYKGWAIWGIEKRMIYAKFRFVDGI